MASVYIHYLKDNDESNYYVSDWHKTILHKLCNKKNRQVISQLTTQVNFTEEYIKSLNDLREIKERYVKTFLPEFSDEYREKVINSMTFTFQQGHIGVHFNLDNINSQLAYHQTEQGKSYHKLDKKLSLSYNKDEAEKKLSSHSSKCAALRQAGVSEKIIKDFDNLYNQMKQQKEDYKKALTEADDKAFFTYLQNFAKSHYGNPGEFIALLSVQNVVKQTVKDAIIEATGKVTIKTPTEINKTLSRFTTPKGITINATGKEQKADLIIKTPKSPDIGISIKNYTLRETKYTKENSSVGGMNLGVSGYVSVINLLGRSARHYNALGYAFSKNDGKKFGDDNGFAKTEPVRKSIIKELMTMGAIEAISGVSQGVGSMASIFGYYDNTDSSTTKLRFISVPDLIERAMQNPESAFAQWAKNEESLNNGEMIKTRQYFQNYSSIPKVDKVLGNKSSAATMSNIIQALFNLKHSYSLKRAFLASLKSTNNLTT